MSDSVAVVWDESLLGYTMGGEHPLHPVRLDLTMRLAESLGVLTSDRLRVRVLFAVAAHRQDEVRERIDEALRAHWTVFSSGCVRLAPEEKDHARKLVRSLR